MRIPYASTTPIGGAPETEQIYQRIKARRHPRPLLPLDLALLHNPAIADGYNALLGAIRTKSSLPPALRELAICCVAVLTHAVYEWKSHSAQAVAVGVSRSKLEKLLSQDLSWHGFDEQEQAVLAYAKQSTVQVKVDDEVFAKTKAALGDDQKVVELTITIGAYNMVSRFLTALDVTESNDGELELPPE